MPTMESREAIRLLEEALRQDLERCRAAVQAGDKAAALTELESAFAKLDTALDMIRTAPQRVG
jgi:ribosomal protein S20